MEDRRRLLAGQGNPAFSPKRERLCLSPSYFLPRWRNRSETAASQALFDGFIDPPLCDVRLLLLLRRLIAQRHFSLSNSDPLTLRYVSRLFQKYTRNFSYIILYKCTRSLVWAYILQMRGLFERFEENAAIVTGYIFFAAALEVKSPNSTGDLTDEIICRCWACRYTHTQHRRSMILIELSKFSFLCRLCTRVSERRV